MEFGDTLTTIGEWPEGLVFCRLAENASPSRKVTRPAQFSTAISSLTSFGLIDRYRAGPGLEEFAMPVAHPEAWLSAGLTGRTSRSSFPAELC
jgi:hypothetical protein